MARDQYEYDVGGELRDRYGRVQYVVTQKHAAPLPTERSLGYTVVDADGRQQIVLTNPLVVSLEDFLPDRTGATPSTTALRNAVSQASAIAISGFGQAHGAVVRVPPGKYLLDGKISIPDGVVVAGDGYNAPVFVTATNFPDNAVFEPAAINNTIQACGIRDFVLYGQTSGSIPVNDQLNAGVATTVATTVSATTAVGGHFPLVANGDISAYANSGTLTVGTKRVKYQSITTATKTFNNCYVVDTGQGSAINSGDAIAPVTHNNIVGVQMLGVAGQTFIHNIWCQYFTGENFLCGNANGLDMFRVNAATSNRDNILLLPNPRATFLRSVMGQYPGVEDTGGTFAGLHVLGQSGTQQFQGFIGLDGFYSELTSHNAIGVWLQNVGSVNGQNICVGGGVNAGGTSFASQVGVQLDSSQSSPLTQDGVHAANISLRNIGCAQVGRVLLKDNVRGRVTPANATAQGTTLTRYDTEDGALTSAVAYSASITPVAHDGWQTITATNGTAFTINAPPAPPAYVSPELVIEVLNSSGGALGVITWNAAYVFATGAWVNPANTKKRFARFRWNGTSWICTSIASADY